MQIITIHILDNGGVSFNYSDGIAPEVGIDACWAVIRQWVRELKQETLEAIEAEVQRRLAAREREEENVQHEGV